MPDIAVVVADDYTVEDFLNGVVLVRAQHHQALVSLVQHNVFADHLAKSAAVKEHGREKAEVVEWVVGFVSPVERELVALIGIVCKVARVYTVGDNEDLDVIKQSVERSLVVTLDLVVGLLQFNAAFLQFNLIGYYESARNGDD